MSTKEGFTSPVAVAAKIIGSKWKILILDALLKKAPLRFTQLKEAIPDISKKVLTECLRALEQDGIITRQAFHEVPPRVEYSLSEQGKGLDNVFSAMQEWGKGYISGDPVRKPWWRIFRR